MVRAEARRVRLRASLASMAHPSMKRSFPFMNQTTARPFSQPDQAYGSAIAESRFLRPGSGGFAQVCDRSSPTADDRGGLVLVAT